MLKKSLLFATLSLAAIPLAAFANAAQEISTATEHAGFAAQGKDLATVKMHLHHALNCLEGPMGVGFDKDQMNPCNGQGAGAIKDAMTAETQNALEAAAKEAMAGIAAGDLMTAQKDAAQTQTMLKAIH